MALLISLRTMRLTRLESGDASGDEDIVDIVDVKSQVKSSHQKEVRPNHQNHAEPAARQEGKERKTCIKDQLTRIKKFCDVTNLDRNLCS